MTEYFVVQMSDRDVANMIVTGASYDGKMPAGLYLTTLIAAGVAAGRKLGAQTRLEPLDDALHDVARSAARELIGQGLDGLTDNLFRLQAFLDRYPARGRSDLHNPAAAAPLPDDVRALVIAAREVTDAGTDDLERRALLDAVDAFSSRVPYENEAEALGGEDRFVGDGHRPGTFRQVGEGETWAAPIVQPGEVTVWLHAPTMMLIAGSNIRAGKFYTTVSHAYNPKEGFTVPIAIKPVPASPADGDE